MAAKRMTANPIKPARYRPGKPVVEEHSSEEEDDDDDDQDEIAPAGTPPSAPAAATSSSRPPPPPPKATSFPTDTTKIASNLKQVDLNERKRQAAVQEAARLQAEKAAWAIEEEGFVTEESGEEGKEGESEDETSGSDSGSDESSSEEEEAPPKVHLRPTFIRKDQRGAGAGGGAGATSKTEDEIWAEEEVRRKAKTDAMIQEQIEKNLAAQAAGKKDWDDDEDSSEADQVDDTDGLDPEIERAAWKLRELKRVQRERAAIETAEKEREEIERRRNLSREDREAEDNEFLAQQQTERDSKGKMGYMQKYFHRGAFFQDDSYAQAEGLHKRDIMASRYQDDTLNRELLPQYMQIRDMAKLGRKGRTKYKDLKTEDTGRWGGGAERGGWGGGGERGGWGRAGGGERGGWGRAGGGERGGERGRFGGRDGMDSGFNRKRSRSPPYRERERDRDRDRDRDRERRGESDDHKRRRVGLGADGRDGR